MSDEPKSETAKPAVTTDATTAAPKPSVPLKTGATKKTPARKAAAKTTATKAKTTPAKRKPAAPAKTGATKAPARSTKTVNKTQRKTPAPKPESKAATPAKPKASRSNAAPKAPSAAKAAQTPPKNDAPQAAKTTTKPAAEKTPPPKPEADTSTTDYGPLDASEVVFYAFGILLYSFLGFAALGAALLLRFTHTVILRGNSSLASLCKQLDTYVVQILAYAADPDAPMPFPFSPWPSAPEEKTEK